MLSSPYFQHALYSIACLSISINLVSMRRFAEEEKSRASARISILESVKEQLTKSGPDQDADDTASKELERLMRLANNRTSAVDRGVGDDVSWSDIFSGKAPKVEKSEEFMSRWEKEDLEKLRKELK